MKSKPERMERCNSSIQLKLTFDHFPVKMYTYFRGAEYDDYRCGAGNYFPKYYLVVASIVLSLRLFGLPNDLIKIELISKKLM